MKLKRQNTAPMHPCWKAIDLPKYRGEELVKTTRAERFERFRRQVYLDFLTQEGRVLEIKPEDLPTSPSEPEIAASPASFNIMARLLEEAGQKYLYISSAGGNASATQLLGRFSAGDPALRCTLTEVGEQEERLWPDAIIAEVAHLPEDRTGNILFREHLAKYEIPYLSTSTLPQEQQIPLSDLYLKYQQGRLILWSHRLQKVIIPKQSTAHNYSYKGLPIYTFLCDMAYQQSWRFAGVWNWGEFAQQPFLPRVVYKHLILSPATWQIEASSFEGNAQSSLSQMWAFVKQLQLDRKLPSHVVISEGDNELFLDLDNPLFVRYFVHELLKKKRIKLREALAPANSLLVRQGQATYTNEIVFSAIRNQPFKVSRLKQPSLSQVQRSFYPGDQWYYVKLYCDPQFADRFLTEVLPPLIHRLIEDRTVEKWFFLRYADPEYHLRLRFFHSNNQHFHSLVQSMLAHACAPFLGSRIQRMVVDTYERELERYGGTWIETAESIFYHDSITALSLLRCPKVKQETDALAMVAVRDIATLMDGLGVDLEQQLEIVENCRDSFFTEFHLDQHPEVGKQIGQKFNKLKQDLHSGIFTAPQEDHEIHAILRTRTQALQDLAPLGGLKEKGASWKTIVASLLHMSLNRLFRVSPRQQETVVYDLLARSIRSKIAREATSAKSNVPRPM